MGSDVITSMLDDLFQQQPINTAIYIGGHVPQYDKQPLDWQQFNLTELLNLPFQQRYDLALVMLNDQAEQLTTQQVTQALVKLRDLMAKRIVVLADVQQQSLLRALGFSQLIESSDAEINLWQFNILTYKHVPDWFNSKFWANPDNWDKYRW